MVKYFYDFCGKEIFYTSDKSNASRARLKGKVKSPRTGKTINIEVITGLNGAINDGLFCFECIKKAVWDVATTEAALRQARDAN